MPNTKTRLGVSAWAISLFLLTLGSNGVRSLIGWTGFLIAVAVIFGIGIWLLIRHSPERFKWYRVPKPLFAMLFLAALSILWSAYRLESTLGVIAQLVTTGAAVSIATVLSWHEILRTLSTALRYLLGLSLLFEIFVALYFGHPILQGFVDVDDPENPSKLLYWSRALIFEGGPIQGLVANSALLGFAALLALIVFSIQLRGGLVGRVHGWFWVLSRSQRCYSHVRQRSPLHSWSWSCRLCSRSGPGVSARNAPPVYVVGASLLAVSVAIAITARSWLLPLLGKSPDLTGRFEIWEKVSALASERPAFGWGWISYWAPWVEPFKSLDTKVGLPVMHAHNAWLDVWLQLGWVGVILFALLVLMTLQRVWCRAVDAPRRGRGETLPYATSTLFPWLVMSALVVQSLTESRLLVESGWLLLIIFAVKARIDYELPSLEDEPPRIPWRHIPIVRDQHRKKPTPQFTDS